MTKQTAGWMVGLGSLVLVGCMAEVDLEAIDSQQQEVLSCLRTTTTAPAATITSLYPAQLPASGTATYAEIDGTGFRCGSTVELHDLVPTATNTGWQPTSIEKVFATNITYDLTAAQTTGYHKYEVRVTTPGGVTVKAAEALRIGTCVAQRPCGPFPGPQPVMVDNCGDTYQCDCVRDTACWPGEYGNVSDRCGGTHWCPYPPHCSSTAPAGSSAANLCASLYWDQTACTASRDAGCYWNPWGTP